MSLMERRMALMGGSPASSRQLLGDWGRIYVERITIGENTVASTLAAINFIAGKRSDTSGNVFAIRRASGSPTPAINEFGGFSTTTGYVITAYRYRNGWVSTTIGSNYDTVLTPGSIFDVLSLKFNTIVS